VTTDAHPDVVWRIWADLDEMRKLPAVASISGEGPISSGSEFRMRVRGALPQRERVTEYEEGRRFLNEARRPGVVLRYEHVLEPLENGGSRLNRIRRAECSRHQVGGRFVWLDDRAIGTQDQQRRRRGCGGTES
jgi:polyketide cyclase/dehydrase/lipid transport protein